MNADYYALLERKQNAVAIRRKKFDVEPHPLAKHHQAHALRHLIEVGTGAAFLDTGLGKTFLQLDWARHIPGEVLILAPLAVAQQTAKEARELLGMDDVAVSRDGNVVSRVTVTNYERAHLFDVGRFSGVVLDESSILKGQNSKTRRWLTEAFRETPWKLACTATPAPNDHTELGNHAEFLGIMSAQEMLARWFVHDSMNTAEWRLKGHAVKSFWEWVGSWASCISMPSDVGGDDEGYALPPIKYHTHMVESPLQTGGEEMLFNLPDVSATALHATKRQTVSDRCGLIADIVNASSEPWVVWCESNEESDTLAKLIPDAVEVAGHHSIDAKESRMVAFSEGSARVIVSKPSIAGFGLNWQHACKMAFASISYSYESFYQAVRREWRFGQKRPVDVHVCISDAELPVWRAIERKAGDHQSMKDHMRIAARVGVTSEVKVPYNPTHEARLPRWLDLNA